MLFLIHLKESAPPTDNREAGKELQVRLDSLKKCFSSIPSVSSRYCRISSILSAISTSRTDCHCSRHLFLLVCKNVNHEEERGDC